MSITTHAYINVKFYINTDWKRYKSVSVKWVCQIKNRGMVTGIDTFGHYLIPEI